MITLLNDARLEKGLPPMGFLNHFLYDLPASAFIDAVGGRNDGSPIDSSCSDDSCGPGFTAIAGFDTVTGRGMPIFSKLRDAALQHA